MLPLSAKQLAIDVGNVTKGMYVSKLDRPWLETPFLFRGFEIKEQSEIDQLQQYCRLVFVDVDRGDLSPDQVKLLLHSHAANDASGDARRMPAKGPGPVRRSLQNLLGRLGMNRNAGAAEEAESKLEAYPIQATVRGEAERANEAFQNLAEHHRDMMEYANFRCQVKTDALRRAVQPAIKSVLRNPNALAWTVFSRKHSNEDYNRAVGTTIWCLLLGRQLGFSREMLDDLAMGGMLLDIGNARIPGSIAATEGDISEEQYESLRLHVELGVQILECSQEVPGNVMDMIRCHHERADGSGYPHGLRGNDIPPFGRIAGIADCYDAMTTISPYSKPMAAYDAARALNDMRGREFAAEVVEQFLATMGTFPVGSIVELNDGCIGVVLVQNPENALRPKVMVLLDKDRNPLPERQIIEMRDLPVDVTHSSAKWIVNGHEHGAFGIDPLKIFEN